MTSLITVPGTHARRRGPLDMWWTNSKFTDRLKDHAIEPWRLEDPFNWSTDLDGTPWTGAHYDWQAGGDALRYYMLGTDFEQRNILTHSHGLQVALYAAASGQHIRRLISVTGPVRKDMEKITELARPHIDKWLHIHTDGSDWVQLLGAVFDGHIGIHREQPLADINDSVKGVGHSGLLIEPEHFWHWSARGWFDFLK
jgi:hypothetical protein